MDLRDIIEYKIKPNIPQPLWESWYIKEKIGSGSFSVVYRVEAQRDDQVDEAALKIEVITVDGLFFDTPSRKASFLNNKKQLALSETKIMKNLRDCPYIVRYEEELMRELYIDGDFEGYYNLIRMEYLQNVFDLMKSGEFDYSEDNVKKLTLEICQGLKAAHDIGVIHRDVKPENLFVSNKGIYKLGDFNISKKAVSTRSFAGTHYYMAPEIYRAKSSVEESYTQQADIYSFGLCLYQMMNDGLLPFEDSLDPDAANDKRMQGAIIQPPKNASQLFSRIILKACAFDISSRYNSIDEMITELTREIKNNKARNTEYTGNLNDGIYISRDNNMTQYAEENSDSAHKNNKPVIWISILIALGITIGLLFLFTKCNNQDKLDGDAYTSFDSEMSSKLDNMNSTESKSNQTSINHVVTTTKGETTIIETNTSVIREWTTSNESVLSGWILDPTKTEFSYSEWGAWSIWSTDKVIETDLIQIETKIENRYTDWGEWSNWLDTSISETDLRRVESKNETVSEIIGYNMYHYITQSSSSPYYRQYREFSINNEFDLYGVRPSYGERKDVKQIDLKTLDNATTVLSGAISNGQYGGYNLASVIGYNFSGDDGFLWFKGDPITKDYTITKYRYSERAAALTTLYRYREREKKPNTYHFYRDVYNSEEE